MSPTWCYIIACLVLPVLSHAQEPGRAEQFILLPENFFHSLNKKVGRLEARLSAQTEKYLQKLAKREQRLKRGLSRVDSVAASDLFNDSGKSYAELIQKMRTGSATSGLHVEYLPYTDSVRSGLSFIDQNKAGIPVNLQGKAKDVLDRFKLLQGRMQEAEEIRQFIGQRKQQIKEALSRFARLPKSLTKRFADFKRDAFYYSQQAQQYKDLLNDPDKITQKALMLLNRLPAFGEFMKQHSALASLFPIPAGYGTAVDPGGLQTRAQVQSLMQGQLAAAGPNGQQILRQNLQAAQAQLNRLKDKLKQTGGGADYTDMPNFKPNSQRTKSFLQRLELGTNMQSTKSNYFWPTTTDLGLSLGYRLSDKSTIGIGGSYKVGLGKDIRNIVITSEGASLRSFLDIKIRGSFFLSGGYEYNYQPAVKEASNIMAQKGFAWTQSGLVGLSKIVSLKTKFFQKAKLQLLWDFMSYQQVPRKQPLVFRIGYMMR